MTEKTRSRCPISTSLDILGDRWTLVILRDLFSGKSKYSEFLASPEGITTNILAARLARMEETGLVFKTPYQTRPLRHAYALTPRGRGLKPTMQALCRWANAEFPETWTPPAHFMEPDGQA